MGKLMSLEFGDKIKLTVSEIINLISKDQYSFPKYASSIINLANRFAQATRPEVVGQMSELIKECPYKNFEGWKKWYIKTHPNSIENATKKIVDMLEKFKEVLEDLNEEVVKKWVEDLVLVKTFIGLMMQEPILKYFSNLLKKDYRLSTPEEESKGIDGYIDDFCISIKPETYKEKEKITGEHPGGDVIIFYNKDENNNIIITEIKSLTKKGDDFIRLIKKFLSDPYL